MVDQRKFLQQYTFIKPGVSVYDFLLMHPALLSMVAFTLNFCWVNNIKMVISSIYRPPNDGISKSKTHQSLRAVDISLKGAHGWNDLLIAEYRKEIEESFIREGALSYQNGESRPIVIHDAGSGRHAHLQIRPNL